MHRMIGRLLILVAFWAIAPSAALMAGNPVIDFAGDNPQMNAAIRKAREALPEFWRRLENPVSGERNFSIKIKITEGDVHEHIWAGDIKRAGDELSAAIENEPVHLKLVALGQRISVDQENITDWMYIDSNDRIHGAYTLRVMLPHMPRQEADRWRRSLAAPD